jgi:hypothetical protein
MPPIRSQNSQKRVEQEGRLLLAIQIIKNQELSSIRKAAEVFNVPLSTLTTRLNGITYRAETRANSHKLTIFEEQSLYKWIISLDDRGAAPRPDTVRDAANILLRTRGSDPPTTVGKNWYKNLLEDTLTFLLDSHDPTTTGEYYVRIKARFERGLTS